MKVRVRTWDRVDNGQDLWVWVAERFICDKTQILFRVNLVSYLVSLATHQYNTFIFLDFCMVSLLSLSKFNSFPSFLFLEFTYFFQNCNFMIFFILVLFVI